MEVILREHVENLGQRGDVVKVASGYARNYLLPRKLALTVTDGNRKQIERERKVADMREAEERQGAEGIAADGAARRPRPGPAPSRPPAPGTDGRTGPRTASERRRSRGRARPPDRASMPRATPRMT